VRKTARWRARHLLHRGVANRSAPKYSSITTRSGQARRGHGTISSASGHGGLLRRGASLLIDRLLRTSGAHPSPHARPSGNGIAALILAIECGAHRRRRAGMMSGSQQPSLELAGGGAARAPAGHAPGQQGRAALSLLGDVREIYARSKAGLKSSTTEVYFQRSPAPILESTGAGGRDGAAQTAGTM